ncbi:hypothetical protein, conserved [Eimeria praecox]|uniref:Ubiquitin-like domain-containing protein n=1 Tax=Eimeria praecox TaxID=51316 RepID=U6H8E8_9EIME|nr:hypothetical protein, conserved [Eimeria praecox]
MKIQVEVTDLRDDKQYTAIVEAWETLETVRSILADKVPNAPPKHQFFYVRDEFVNASIPADQLRKKSRAAGMLDDVEEKEGEPKLARCFLYVNATPLDFSDMLNDDIFLVVFLSVSAACFASAFPLERRFDKENEGEGRR